MLSLTRIGPGSKPALEGTLVREENHASLQPLSYAKFYPIQKPEASGALEYALELTLALSLDGICAVDGFVEDSAGNRDFSEPVVPEAAALRLTFASMTETGCDSLWEPMAFEKVP